jgi:hypothetical protein
MQRQVKRATTAPFGVAVFGLEREDGAVEDVLARLTAAKINCDFNYVTAPTPMRSHAVSYAEPAAVAAIPPALDTTGQPNVVIGVLDTGRPHYDTSFIDYYRTRFAPASGDQAVSPLTALDSRFVAAAGLASGNEPHDDRDTMVMSFGRLAHPHAGHGMFVASIIARHAPGANLLAETTMSGDSIGDLYDMLVDLEHAADSGCRILNMSMGFNARDGADGQLSCPPLLDQALRRLAERNVKLVASAGNDGSRRPSWPAAHDTVVAVAAVDANGDPTEWSNFGTWVDACALGNEVVSDYVYADWDHPDGSARRFSGAAMWSGTSFAAPLVAALLATAYSEALTSSAADQQPRVDDVWQTLVGKAWSRQIGTAAPTDEQRGQYPYGPRLD